MAVFRVYDDDANRSAQSSGRIACAIDGLVKYRYVTISDRF